MAYPGSTSPAKPAPPKNVETAALLLQILAIFAVVNAVLSLIGQKDAEIDDNSDVSEGTQNAVQLVGGVLGLLIAVGIGVGAWFLAKGLLKGSQGARTGTWVLCGLWIFCGLCGGCTSIAGPEVDGIPGWYTGWQWIATFAILGLAVAVAALLATPAANVFFKPVGLMPPGYGPGGVPPASQFGSGPQSGSGSPGFSDGFSQPPGDRPGTDAQDSGAGGQTDAGYNSPPPHGETSGDNEPPAQDGPTGRPPA